MAPTASTPRQAATPRLPTLGGSVSYNDRPFAATVRGATPGEFKRKVAKAVRFELRSESTDKRGAESVTQMCAPHHNRKKMGYVSQAMRDSILQTSNLCTSALVKQSHQLIEPERQPHRPRYNVVERRNGFVLYEAVRYNSIAEDDEDEGEACVDDNVVLLRESADSLAMAATAVDADADNTPRMSGSVQLQASLEEFISTFSCRDEHDNVQQLLNPSMSVTERVHTFLDEKNKRICVKWMVLEPKGAGTMARRRDFVVVECQKRFQLHDGRRGWVQSLHSIDFPWYPPHDSEDGFVRGTIHQSGVVAIESLEDSKCVEVVVTAQVSLKGNSSAGAQRAVSRRRVVKTMEALGEVIATDRVERMSYVVTDRFAKLELDQKDRRCKVCCDRVGLLGLKPRHACRKCGGSVCGGCSQVWQVERTRSSAMVAGGRVTTRTRVCTECLVHARQRDPAASPRDSSSTDDFKRDFHPPTKLLAATLPLPRLTDTGLARERDNSVFDGLDSMEPLRPTLLEFAIMSKRNMSPTESLLGDSDGTTDDEDDHPGSPFYLSPRDRLEVVRSSKELRVSDLAI